MILKFGAVFILLVFCQVGSSSWIPSLKGTSTIESFNGSIEKFRHVYLAFPCSDKAIVERIFNNFHAIRNLNSPEQLEAEEAEMDLLYLMVIGKSANISLTKWYLIFEKTVDAYDKSMPFREERLKANEKMLQFYLTQAQIKKFNVFTQFIESNGSPSDLTVLLRYLYGFPIGFALGLSEHDITSIVEEHSTMQEVATELGKLANNLCQNSFPGRFEPNDHIAHDLIRALLTNRT